MAEIKDPENTIILETTKGKVVIQLLPEVAPGHVARIKELASEKAYDGVVFHRVISGFMAQTGDVKFGKQGGGQPGRAGMGGSDKPNLKAEFSTVKHLRGTARWLARRDPNSANSQFFICFDDATFLDTTVHRLGPGHRRHGQMSTRSSGRATEGS
jgi:peptidyl-prolyl cis-trans isomerase B (cyclophilin B)